MNQVVIPRGQLSDRAVNFQRVVIDGKVMEWSGIGWIPVRQATEHDLKTLPRVE